MSIQKRCYYEVLSLPQSCTQDEIRSSYKKLALQRHPDKLVQSGIPAGEATALFQELRHAYEVLSDPKERSWYDSHRSQILFSQTGNSDSDDNSPFPDLFSYFSPSCYTDYVDPKTGFYKVYGDLFDRVYANEVVYCRKMGLNLGLVKEAPLMGALDSDYTQVSAFYGYWINFATVMDFGWVGKWDAAGGVNRKSRRVMEDENKKVRKKARKEFNDTVRGLAEFVKKRDKRVIDMMVKKEKEREKKREEEIAKRKEREREKLEKARMYEEPEWARVQEVEEFENDEDQDDEEKKELYCVACGKKFKSDKQWRNHEQSKKHKEKVAELRKTFEEEDFEEVEEMDEYSNDEGKGEAEAEAEAEAKQDMRLDDECTNDIGDDGFASAEDDVDEIEDKFTDSVRVDEDKSREEPHLEDDDNNNTDQHDQLEEALGSEDNSSILEAMLCGRKNKKNVALKNQQKNPIEGNNAQSEDEMEPMEYNNKKVKKKSRRAKKEKGKVSEAEATRGGDNDTTAPPGEDNVRDETHSTTDFGGDYSRTDDGAESSINAGKKPVERKGTYKEDADAKLKNSSKGRKGKEKSKNSDPVCEKCGEEFESRSKLFKHLSDTGHASLKSNSIRSLSQKNSKGFQ